MERVLEGLITYSEDHDHIIEFFIIYPPANSVPENSSDPSNLLLKIQRLESTITEKDSKLLEKDSKLNDLANKLSELSSTNSNLSFELEEKAIEISTLQESIQNYQSELASLTDQLASVTQQLELKSLQCTKLQKSLNDLKNNRKTAEVLLEKQEIMNKDLIAKNVKLEKLAQDSEKKNQENLKIIQKLKEEIFSSAELSKQRDEQIKSVIKKVKILEADKIKLTDELRKKEMMIKKVSSGETVEVVVEKNQSPPKEIKKVMEMLAVKDNEIKLMKDMIKSFQAKQHKVVSQQPAGKSVKLPPINSEKPIKRNERQIRVRDQSQSSLKNLSKAESFAANHSKNPIPSLPKKNFKTLFADSDLQSSPNNSSINKSPFLAEAEDFNEELRIAQNLNRNERKSQPKVSKKMEMFADGLEVGRKKLDFNEENSKSYQSEEIKQEKNIEKIFSEQSLNKDSVTDENVRIETENNETLSVDYFEKPKENEVGVVEDKTKVNEEVKGGDTGIVEDYKEIVEDNLGTKKEIPNEIGENWENNEEVEEYKEENFEQDEENLDIQGGIETNLERKEEKDVANDENIHMYSDDNAEEDIGLF